MNQTNTRVRKLTPLLPLLMLLTLASCATTKGALFKQVVAASPPPAKSSSSVQVQASDTNPEQTGLEVQTTPSDAQVFLNDQFIGDTPLVYTDFQAGSYKVTVTKRGYHDYVHWLTIDPANYTLVQVDLAPKTGFLRISVTPAGAQLTVDGNPVNPGLRELPVGTHRVRIREFGYEDWSEQVVIRENRTVALHVHLTKAPFRISSLSLSRTVLNPLNPGPLAQVAISFEVSTYGTGQITIVGPDDKTVFEQTLPRFVQREQSLRWDGRNQQGVLVPDGNYRVTVSGRETETTPVSRASTELQVSRQAFIHLRSVWSGVSGLLYAPTPEVLPSSSYAIGGLALAHVEANTAAIPMQLALRAVPAPGIEIDAQAMAELMSTSAVPFSVGLAGKFALLGPLHPSGLSAAVTLKGTYLSGTTADSLTNFTGLSVGFPAEYRLGPVGLVLDPEVILAPYPVSYSGTVGPIGLTSWGYARAGLLFDTGSFVAGASLALRTAPFANGLKAASVPLAGGIELHWLIPRTQLVLSGAVAGELSPGASGGYYLMAGAGLGFVN